MAVLRDLGLLLCRHHGGRIGRAHPEGDLDITARGESYPGVAWPDLQHSDLTVTACPAALTLYNDHLPGIGQLPHDHRPVGTAGGKQVAVR